MTSEYYAITSMLALSIQFLKLLKEEKYSFGFQVPPVLIRKIFSQTFSYINVQLFNR